MTKKIMAFLAAAAFGGSLLCMSAEASQYTSYTWEAGEYWVNAGEEFCIEPMVYCDPGNIMAIQFDLKTPALDKGAVKLTAAGDSDGFSGTAYPSFSDMMFNMEKMHAGGSDSGMGLKGVPAAEDGSTLGEMWYAAASEKAVISAADSCGITIKQSSEKNCWYYEFPLEFDPSINEAAGSPMCEAVLTDETSMKINFVAGSINIIISDEAAAIEAAKTTVKADENSGSEGDASADEPVSGGMQDDADVSDAGSADNAGSSGDAAVSDNESSGDPGQDASSESEEESADGITEDEADAEPAPEAEDIDEEAIELEEIGSDSDSEKSGSSGKVIAVVIAGIAVLGAGGGIAAALLLRKKK